MPVSFIPRADSEFNVWQKESLEFTEANAKTWKIPEESITEWKSNKAKWEVAYDKADNKETRSHADVLAKNEARKEYEKDLRAFFNAYIKYNPAISDEERLEFGIHPKGHGHTPVPVPETVPEGRVDFSIRLQHKIVYHDSLTPNSKAKPKGVHGCQIWMKLGGDAPVNEEELTFLITDTSSPYKIKFKGEDAGKKAYYWLRWVNSKGEVGPWSSLVSGIIAG